MCGRSEAKKTCHSTGSSIIALPSYHGLEQKAKQSYINGQNPSSTLHLVAERAKKSRKEILYEFMITNASSFLCQFLLCILRNTEDERCLTDTRILHKTSRKHDSRALFVQGKKLSLM
jgi:hypothetical protein